MTTRKAMVIGSAATMLIASGDKDFLGETERRFVPIALDPDLPDRLCIERDSPHYSSSTALIGVRVNGEDNGNVVEYCVSGGWVRLGVRDHEEKIKRDPQRRPYGLQTTRLDGVEVEPYWRQNPSRQVRRAMARGK